MEQLPHAFYGHAVAALGAMRAHAPQSVLAYGSYFASTFDAAYRDVQHSVVEPVLWPYVLRPIKQLLDSPPTLGNIIALAVFLWVAFQILEYMRRVIMFWVKLIFRLMIWAAIGTFLWYVYTMGMEEAVRMVAGVVSSIHGAIVPMVDNAFAFPATGGTRGQGYAGSGRQWGQRASDTGGSSWFGFDRGQHPLRG
ncbi:hypothetical protein KEM52_001216 [Ascosphaera acerosa]|nr:hypothetical protein KEM52_001216 [Ascosphaera acerosa]